MRFLAFTTVLLALAAGSFGQPAQKAAPAAPKLTGFPFQDETLRYSIRWPSSLSLGEALFSAAHGVQGWTFDVSLDAGVPGFAIKDSVQSRVTDALCSLELDRNFSHGPRKTHEKTTFDQRNREAKRVTVLPLNGGRSDFSIPSCAKDALAFVYYMRQEMGQGRVAPAQQVFLGGGYSVSLQYTGEVTIKSGAQQAVTDRVVASVKGPRSDNTAEIFFARDPARTPLLIRIPISMGTISVELVR